MVEVRRTDRARYDRLIRAMEREAGRLAAQKRGSRRTQTVAAPKVRDAGRTTGRGEGQPCSGAVSFAPTSKWNP